MLSALVGRRNWLRRIRFPSVVVVVSPWNNFFFGGGWRRSKKGAKSFKLSYHVISALEIYFIPCSCSTLSDICVRLIVVCPDYLEPNWMLMSSPLSSSMNINSGCCVTLPPPHSTIRDFSLDFQTCGRFKWRHYANYFYFHFNLRKIFTQAFLSGPKFSVAFIMESREGSEGRKTRRKPNPRGKFFPLDFDFSGWRKMSPGEVALSSSESKRTDLVENGEKRH